MLIDNDNNYVSDIEVGASCFIISAFNTEHIPETNTKYCVTSFSSENKRLDINTYNLLKRYYNNIIIFVDYDKEGIKNAFYHNVLFNIKTVFLGNNNDVYSEFTDKEIQRFFDRILLVNPNITLFSGMIKSFINDYRGDYKQKDMFEYTTVNGLNKGEKLTNTIFKI